MSTKQWFTVTGMVDCLFRADVLATDAAEAEKVFWENCDDLGECVEMCDQWALDSVIPSDPEWPGKVLTVRQK